MRFQVLLTFLFWSLHASGVDLHQLELSGWKTLIRTEDAQLVSFRKNLSHVFILKDASNANLKLEPHRWIDTERGSFYYLLREKKVLFILDLNSHSIDQETKQTLLQLVVPKATHEGTTYWKKDAPALSLIPLAYAEECRLTPELSGPATEIETFSDSFLGKTIPTDALSFLEKLKTCGVKAFTEMDRDVRKILSDPKEYLSENWEKAKQLVEFAKQFSVLAPQILEGMQNIPDSQVKEIVWTVLCPMATKILTATAVMGVGSVSIELIKELEILKKMLLNFSQFTKDYKALELLHKHHKTMPKTPTLTIQNGRTPNGTLARQKEALANFVDGKLMINGKEAEPGFYAGVFLEDGRHLVINTAKGNHNDLVLLTDKVGTAVEYFIGSDKSMRLFRNQSGTYLPDFEDAKKWVVWWTKKQEILHGKSTSFDLVGLFKKYIPPKPMPVAP